MPKWTPEMSGVPQASMLGPIIFYVFTNDAGNGIECMLSKFAHGTKLSGPADLVDG